MHARPCGDVRDRPAERVGDAALVCAASLLATVLPAGAAAATTMTAPAADAPAAAPGGPKGCAVTRGPLH